MRKEWHHVSWPLMLWKTTVAVTVAVAVLVWIFVCVEVEVDVTRCVVVARIVIVFVAPVTLYNGQPHPKNLECQFT